MKFLDPRQGRQWVHALGWIDLEPDPEILSNKFSYGVSYLIPEACSRKTALAGVIASIVSEARGTGLLWISSFSVWEAENWDLFYGYRRSLGESRSLEDAPYHVFGVDDYVAVECLLDLILYFMWDAILIDDQNGVSFQFSHDEWLAVASDDSDFIEATRQTFERFQLEPHPHAGDEEEQ